MKIFKQLLIKLDACNDAKIWAGDMTIEEVIRNSERGDWLLWLAKKVDIPIRPLTLAKARCAKTVIHLMKDQKSIDAVNLAEKFGLTDEVSLDDLKVASKAAAAAYAADAATARKKNQQQTSDICVEILGGLITNKVNELIK